MAGSGVGAWPVRARRYWLILNMQISLNKRVFSVALVVAANRFFQDATAHQHLVGGTGIAQQVAQVFAVAVDFLAAAAMDHGEQVVAPCGSSWASITVADKGCAPISAPRRGMSVSRTSQTVMPL